jgi:hypothetical protein
MPHLIPIIKYELVIVKYILAPLHSEIFSRRIAQNSSTKVYCLQYHEE